MKPGAFSKTALTVALMMGQVTPQHSAHQYYEDDSDFDQIASAFTGGWGWSLNRAEAACDNNATSVDECITVSAPQIPDQDPWGGYDPYPDIPEDTGSTSSGGEGSGGAAPAPTDSEPELTPQLQCQLDALKDKNDCYEKANLAYQVKLLACTLTLEAGPVAFALCGGAATALYEKNKGSCDEQYFEENAYCSLSTP